MIAEMGAREHLAPCLWAADGGAPPIKQLRFVYRYKVRQPGVPLLPPPPACCAPHARRVHAQPAELLWRLFPQVLGAGKAVGALYLSLSA